MVLTRASPLPHPCASVKELGEVSAKHLLPGFGEEEDHEEIIARTVQEITQLFKDCERRLKEIHAEQNDGSGDEVCRPSPTSHGFGGSSDPRPGRPAHARSRPAAAVREENRRLVLDPLGFKSR